MAYKFDEELIKYIELKNRLKEYQLKSNSIDIQYAKNFPRNSIEIDRIKYNKKYEKQLIELEKEYNLINDEFDKVEGILSKFGLKIHHQNKLNYGSKS